MRYRKLIEDYTDPENLISDEAIERLIENLFERSNGWWKDPRRCTRWYTYRPWGSRHTIIKLDNMPKLPGACDSSTFFFVYDTDRSYFSLTEAISEEDYLKIVGL